MTLTHRQLTILDSIRKRSGGAATREILAELRGALDHLSRITVIRDLDAQIARGMVRKMGKGRAVRYVENLANPSQRHIDHDAYFMVDDIRRALLYPTYHPSALAAFSDAFTPQEYETLTTLNDAYRQRMGKLPPTVIRKEMERFTAEFSWKSSQIEGNTYSLLDTEVLLKEQREADGHPYQEAQMILNHKAALEFIAAHPGDYTPVSLRTIEQLHALIVKNLGVTRGLRGAPVGILGTTYRPMGIRTQLREALQAALDAINAQSHPPAKSLMALLLIAYIQPFEDGNKRTARLLGNALLIAHGFCPLSFRSIDEKEYKKAVILFYEQHNIRYFKQLFIEQFSYAAKHYFLT
ncbi:MAG: Fic family protein [Patescibacteria group bacterium]